MNTEQLENALEDIQEYIAHVRFEGRGGRINNACLATVRNMVETLPDLVKDYPKSHFTDTPEYQPGTID